MKKFIKISIFALMLLFNLAVFAQGSTGDGNGGLEGNDAPPAPIDNQLIYLAVVGLFLAFVSFKKYNNKITI